MIIITKELKAKLLAAQNAEEVAELVKAAGREITAEDAACIYEIRSRVEGMAAAACAKSTW